jgi:hypothetical protein
MRRPIRMTLGAFLAGLFLCAAFAFQGAAQTNSPSTASQSGQSTEPPAQAPTSAPASVPAAAAQPTPKKVWTNEDVTELRQDSVISTFTPPKSKPTNNGGKPANPKSKQAQWYQNRIAGLQAKLPPIDDQIAELQAALSGQTVNEVRKWGGNRPDDWRVELGNLQKKHDEIENQINALKDQARHDGVPAGALP